MAIEPIKGFYVHDEATDTDGVAKYDAGELIGTVPEVGALAEQYADGGRTITPTVFNSTIYRTPDNKLLQTESYLIVATVPVSGTYTLKAGVTGDRSQMQDTLTTRYFTANRPEVIFPYTPSVANVHFWSLNCNDWDLSLVQKLPDYYNRAGETLHNYETVLTDDSVYSDFNDFPTGSSIVLTSAATTLLDNAPPSGSMYGHAGAQNKETIGTCITYSTGITDNGTLTYCKSQLYVTWTSPTENDDFPNGRHHWHPSISFRSKIIATGVWSDWTRLTQNGSLHATNAVIDENYYNLTVDDLNHVPPNTIYQIDLNCQNLGHNPFPGHSGMVATISFSESYLHGSLQIAACLDGIAKMYFRYGYTSADSFYWTEWAKVVTE